MTKQINSKEELLKEITAFAEANDLTNMSVAETVGVTLLNEAGLSYSEYNDVCIANPMCSYFWQSADISDEDLVEFPCILRLEMVNNRCEGSLIKECHRSYQDCVDKFSNTTWYGKRLEFTPTKNDFYWK